MKIPSGSTGRVPTQPQRPASQPSQDPTENSLSSLCQRPVLTLSSAAVGALAGAWLVPAPLPPWQAALAGGLIGGLLAQGISAALAPSENTGPRLIVGHVDETTAKLWGRGSAEYPYLKAEVRDAQGQTVFSGARRLAADDGFTGVVQANGLQAGQRYSCTLTFSAGPKESAAHSVSGSFTTSNPQANRTSFLMGSCNFHRGPLTGRAFQAISKLAHSKQPEFHLHTGDQIYTDMPIPSVTLDDYRTQYRKGWDRETTRKLLSSRPNYMILDDHEVVNGYGQGDPLSKSARALLWLRGFLNGESELRQHMEVNGLKAYDEFQQSHSPAGPGNVRHYSFSRGPAEFFVMDTRTRRIPEQGQMIDAEQMQQFKNWLKAHPDKPKFVVSSGPFVAEPQIAEDKWSSPNFRGQREEILDFIAAEKIEGVVFISGETHNSYHAECRLNQQVTVHELAASPVNGVHTRGLDMFRQNSSGATAAGNRYQTTIHEASFLGEKAYFNSDFSAIMAVEVEGGEVRWELHRTHRDDPNAVRSGNFQL